MTVGTDAAPMSQAALQAAAALAQALGVDAQVGTAFDPWSSPPPELGPFADAGPYAWSVPAIGPIGPVGELALMLAPGADPPGDTEVAGALRAALEPLSAVLAAERAGALETAASTALLEAKPGQSCIGVPLAVDGTWSCVLLVTSQPAAAELPHLGVSGPAAAVPRSIAALAEVEMTVSVELGRTKIAIKDLLSVHNGSVVQLDRAVTHPVDIFVQGTLIARGEVVVVDECFAVRVTDLLTGG